MAHDHAHDHTKSSARRVLIALILTGAFMVVEVIGGILSGSLALLADAGHMLTDTAALALAWFAFRVSERPPDTKRSFGYHRVQILAAFVNGLTLIAIVGWILFEALQRIFEPREVLAGTMLVVAIAGLLVNCIALWILHSDDEKNLNIRGATAHIIGDLFGSVAAIVAAIVIMASGWTLIDPILSVFVALLVFRSAWSLLKKTAHILLEGMPEWLDTAELKRQLVASVPKLNDVHHVHVWCLNPEHLMLTMHAQIDDGHDQPELLREMKSILRRDFGISHSTIEVDVGQCADDDPHLQHD